MTIDGARGILFNVTGGPDLSLFEVNEAAEIIKDNGASRCQPDLRRGDDENMGDEIRITVIATGFDQGTPVMVKPAAQPQVAVRPRARVLETVGAHVSKAAPAPAPAPSSAARPLRRLSRSARSEPRMAAARPEPPVSRVLTRRTWTFRRFCASAENIFYLGRCCLLWHPSQE